MQNPQEAKAELRAQLAAQAPELTADELAMLEQGFEVPDDAMSEVSVASRLTIERNAELMEANTRLEIETDRQAARLAELEADLERERVARREAEEQARRDVEAERTRVVEAEAARSAELAARLAAERERDAVIAEMDVRVEQAIEIERQARQQELEARLCEEEERMAARIEEARRQATRHTDSEMARLRIIDSETARLQRINTLIAAGNYRMAMTFFRDRKEAVEKFKTLGGQADLFRASARAANWTVITAESLELKQQRALAPK